jgi:hypothetical protein
MNKNSAYYDELERRRILEAALEPFAEHADVFFVEADDDDDIYEMYYASPEPKLTVGHFRAAKRALEAM